VLLADVRTTAARLASEHVPLNPDRRLWKILHRRRAARGFPGDTAAIDEYE
jgi:hypothetical protein